MSALPPKADIGWRIGMAAGRHRAQRVNVATVPDSFSFLPLGGVRGLEIGR